jgi:apolipoprotein N-acyltransferase
MEKERSHPVRGFSEVPAMPRGWLLLVAGVLLTSLTGLRWAPSQFAWISPIPFLLYARRTKTIGGAFSLIGTVIISYSISVAKIATPPITPLMVPLFSFPIGLVISSCVLASEAIRRKAGEGWGVAAFAALVSITDWVWLTRTPFGDMMTMGGTLYADLAFCQFASIAGVPGISLVMAYFQASVASMTAMPKERLSRIILATSIGACCAILIFGSIRLDSEKPGAETVRVAAIATAVGPGADGMPSAEVIAANDENLFAKTERAAALGARLVAWNECATLVDPAREDALVERGRAVAARLGIDLVLAYGAYPESGGLIDNKFVFITSEGKVAQVYRKHHPVPGEPSMEGHEQIGIIDRPYGRVAGAICYDYDFPALAAQQGRLGADIAIVPSSDWEGINPSHGLISRMRGIENGFSIMRPTRWAASAVFDQMGRPRGWMSAAESDRGILVSDIPSERMHTPYSALGDWPVLILSTLALIGSALSIIRRVPSLANGHKPIR